MILRGSTKLPRVLIKKPLRSLVPLRSSFGPHPQRIQEKKDFFPKGIREPQTAEIQENA
jgi:hypothetical protein